MFIHKRDVECGTAAMLLPSVNRYDIYVLDRHITFMDFRNMEFIKNVLCIWVHYSKMILH